MLDLKALAADPHKFKKSLSDRGGDPTEIDRVLAVNEERKKVITRAEGLKAQQNKMNQEIAQLKKNKQDATALLAQLKDMSLEVKRLESEADVVDGNVTTLLERLPNVCHESVPVGASGDDNKEIRRWGEKPSISGKAL